MRKTTTDKNAKKGIKMDAQCNILGYLVSSDEMSRFTPNLYDDIFIFRSKKKDDALSERAKYKQRELLPKEEIAPEIIEEIPEEVIEEVAEPVIEEVAEPVIEEVAEEVVEEIAEPEIIEEPAEEIVEEVIEEVAEPEVAETVEEVEYVAPIPEPVVQEEVVQFIPVPVVPVEVEYVVELEPLPVVVLEPVPVIALDAIPVVDLEVVPEPVVEEVIEEIVEPEPVVEPEPIEEVIEEVVEEEVVQEEPICEEPVAPFMAIMIPSSTEEDAELLKERYKTVPLEKRFERAPESVRFYYSQLKNELLSYENVKSRMSKKFDTFSIGRFTVAKLTVKNDVVKLYLALANDTIDTKYYTEDVSNSEIYDQTPTLHNVKSKRGLKYGIELINEIMSSIGYQKVADYEPVDFAAEFAPVPVSTKKQYIADLMKEQVSVDDCKSIANDLAYDMIDIVKSDKYTINKFYQVNKFRMYTDDLMHWFEDGEIVTIEKLQEKGALPVMDNLFLEIYGRGIIDRKLIVEAHSYDMKAVKMILLADGEVIQYK